MLSSNRYVPRWIGARHELQSAADLHRFTGGGPRAWAGVIRSWFERREQRALTSCEILR